MNEGQPSINFFKQVHIFSLRRLVLISKDLKDYSAIPKFVENVPPTEFQMYAETLGPQALQASILGVLDCDAFWINVADGVPMLAKLAATYKNVETSSADAKRCNSIYKIVLEARHRLLKEENIKALFFLHFNQQPAVKTSETPVAMASAASKYTTAAAVARALFEDDDENLQSDASDIDHS